METHPCIIHGCDYTTNRRWNLYIHLHRKHQYPMNFLDQMKRSYADRKKTERLEIQRGYDFPCPCEHCDLAYPNKKRLNEHIKRKHPEHFEGGGSAQVVCAAPGCTHTCQTREKLARHAAQAHATQNCPYAVDQLLFHNENDFHAWKLELEKDTQSEFAINSSTPTDAASRRVYMWCAKANKARISKLPETERKRFGNYGGRSKRVQSHCTAFITAWYLPDGQVTVKFCRDHIGHDQLGMESKRSSQARARRKQMSVVEDSDDDDSYIDVGGEEIDHEEYVEDEGTMEQRMYSDEEEDGDKKQVIRFLTATDRMRPQLNPSYSMEEEYEEEEEPAGSSLHPPPALRYIPPPPPQPQERPRLAYPRPVRPHMRRSEMKNESDLTMELLRESQHRAMHAVRTEKEREKIGMFNHHLQPLDPPIIRRGRRAPVKTETASDVKLEPQQELYQLDPEDVGQEEEVVDEATVYEEEPETSYEVQEYYVSFPADE